MEHIEAKTEFTPLDLILVILLITKNLDKQ